MYLRAGLSLLMVTVGGVAVLTGEPPGSPGVPDWVRALSGTQTALKNEEWKGSTSSAPMGESLGVAPATGTFPAAARWEVTPKSGQSGRAVHIRPQAGTWQESEPIQVEVLDRAAAEKTGTSGFVFKMERVPATIGRTDVTIDYSSFANIYGAGYASRLQVIALPECALSGCQQPGTVLKSSNDTTSGRLVAEVPDLESASTFAVTAGVSGDQGSFAATDLNISGSWQVAPGSGAFTYSYPIQLPTPGAGSAPTVSMGYSSAAIDGLTWKTNTQPTPIGVGWSDFGNAFIERGYRSCVQSSEATGLQDLCWKGENATISLNGLSGALLPVSSDYSEWRLQSDPGWRVQRLKDAVNTTIFEKQWWKVTGPDGTQYFFGYGHMPGRFTNSILGVGVLADNPGEPCRAAGGGLGGCEQGWRWYLDRVVDPDGNVTSYLYDREDNYYSGINGLAPNSKYHRAAMLKEIIYGGRGWHDDNYSVRVLFGHQYRCSSLSSGCLAPKQKQTGYPDVPTDLICANGQACSIHSPTFFSTKRYASVRTEVKVNNAWKPVTQHDIKHGWGDGLNGVAQKLQVQQIQQTAKAFGKSTSYPPTTFGYKFYDNRSDHDGNITKAMRHNRIITVTNPFGGRTEVVYGFNRHCSTSYQPPSPDRWDLNVYDCFPQAVKGTTGHLEVAQFNKYLVTKLTEVAGRNSPNVVSTYSYLGDPAWAYDTSAFVKDTDEIGWNRWLGYGQVTVTKGTSKTRYTLYRGWHNDFMLWQDAGGNPVPLRKREVFVRTSDGTSNVDEESKAGRIAEEEQLGIIDGHADVPLVSRIHSYTTQTNPILPNIDASSQWVGLASTIEKVAIAYNLWHSRRSVTTYNTNRQAVSTSEEGWTHLTGDERCSLTSYAAPANAGLFMRNYPSVNKRVAGGCTSTNVLSQTEIYYDGSTTLGLIPVDADGIRVRGNPTRQRTQVESARWSETLTEFDDFGRPTRVVDPNGNATSTTYSVTPGGNFTEIPVKTTETNAIGHVSTTEWIPEFGVRTKEVDPNGNTTWMGYDEFGRIDTLWLPTEPLDFAEPSMRFSYDITNKVIRTRKLTSQARTGTSVVFEDTWVVYDGFWRERQVQETSPVAGRAIVSETTYDDRGLLRDETVEQALTGTPGNYIDGGSTWANRTRHIYDEIGREVRSEWYTGALNTRTTSMSYGYDTVTANGSDGRRARQKVDGLGRTIAVEEFDGSVWASSSYGYDLSDNLTSVTDPAGNRIGYSYNLAGWRTGISDPDRGGAMFGYDLAGNMTASVDGLANQVHTRFDALGRQIERRSGSATGPLLAQWQYDTAPLGKGKPHQVTSHTPSGAWVSETTGYDTKGRPLGATLTVPAGLPGMSGSYTVTQSYDRADRVTSMKFPSMFGLPAEEVKTEYSTLGLPTRMVGAEEYVWGVQYDDRGRKLSAGIGPRPGGAAWLSRNWTYDSDQRVNGGQFYLTGGNVIAEHRLTFDNSGNLRDKVTKHTSASWRECFGYDMRNRLTTAHTVTSTSTCADGTPGTGDRAYNNSWQYSPDGKVLSRTENSVSTAYTYPAAGSAHPHAPSKVGTSTYTWNNPGGLTSRTVTGGTESFAWDVQGRLASVTAPTGTTGFQYDADGNRLLRKTPDGKSTLYVAGHEVTILSDGNVGNAVRPYVFEDQLVATRSLTGVDYMVTDAAGSIEMSVPSGGQPSAVRSYLPYGKVRSETGDMATDRGFLGQVEDASTKLSYLNARYYDSVSGLFISPDPLFDVSKVKSLNPYTYSMNNPTSYSDPGGLLSDYTWGVEHENVLLKQQNKALMEHIGVLNGRIAELQNVIKEMQDHINELLTHIDALEAEIARQETIIRRLEQRVRELEAAVAARDRTISKLRGTIARLVTKLAFIHIGRVGKGVFGAVKRALGSLFGGGHGKIGRWGKGHGRGHGGARLGQPDRCWTWKTPGGGCWGAEWFDRLAGEGIDRLAQALCKICKLPVIKEVVGWVAGGVGGDWLSKRADKCGGWGSLKCIVGLD